ncbi:hypothetical protein LCGC14_0147360 [marine sediment metagenome]|uniref:Uncharacterized protein n=1 Tax=marine sediment metagenome TaxID=412755 RepID=A0A0F9V3P8_9ZZZZ
MPPSANKVYSHNWVMKYTYLSTEATEFRSKFRNHVIDNYLKETALTPSSFPKDNVPYRVVICFVIPDLINKGWPKTKTKYRRKDLSNWVKLLEDCVKDLFAYDDSQNVQIILDKRRGNKDLCGVRIQIFELDPEDVDTVIVDEDHLTEIINGWK